MGNTWYSWAEEEKENLDTVITNSRKRLNVLLVGLSGAGKSSLATSMEAAITGKPAREVASAGHFGNWDTSFTLRLRRHEMFDGCDSMHVLNGRMVSSIKNKMPAIYDMPGMINVDDERVAAILRCIMMGRVPSGEAVLLAAGLSAPEIEAMFVPRDDETDNRIDRVVFVHSRAEMVPENLIQAVRKVCNELEVTIFGILTHTDSPDKVCTYGRFSELLGTKGSLRGFQVKLYHSGMAKHGRYRQNYETNYYMLLLWQMIMNTHYPIHSTQ